jgi:peptidoglycan lytic transglycosylase
VPTIFRSRGAGIPLRCWMDLQINRSGPTANRTEGQLVTGYKPLALFACLLAMAALSPAYGAGLKRHASPSTVHTRPIGALASHGRSLHAQRGEASVYSRRFRGHRTASGERFSPTSNLAASKTLPLGTRARVTNVKTGRSAVVRIMDRGPHVRGRIVDLSPATAQQLGMARDGVAVVEVVPIAFEPMHSAGHGWTQNR